MEILELGYKSASKSSRNP